MFDKNTISCNHLSYPFNHPSLQEEKVYAGSAESFGKQWVPGDVVGVFLDLVDHTISKDLNSEKSNTRLLYIISPIP